ncbi:hypothetical protein [Acinetobacter higginsii]|uniref:hypothetical protein n=1 Tax=Acinetobacter higginsii TaxID=70347 RepID=UPI00300B4ED5
MANSYKDPYWSNLSANTEKLLKLPSGLLQNIVRHGEKSNADQVSSVGAKTVFQITPTTRKLVLNKYGVDAYLNDKNSAMAAGLLLQESLKRNNGNVEAAIGEYHGGTDRTKWGPVNKAYRSRVMAAQNGSSQQEQPESTFQRVRANFQQDQAPTIAKVYDVYKSGGLSPEQKKDFEADVRAGRIMLPEGAKLLGKTNSQAVTLPQSVSDAYANGMLNSQQRADLEADIKAGKVKLPVASKFKQTVPDFNEQDIAQPIPTEQGILPPQAPDPTFIDKALGAAEATGTLASSLTTGTAGLIGGAVQGLGQEVLSGEFGTPEAARRVEQRAADYADRLTYSPRTEVGQQYAQATGEALAPLVALSPATAEIGLAAQAARAAKPIAQGAAIQAGRAISDTAQQAARAAQRPIQATSNAVRSGIDNLRDLTGLNRADNGGPAPANIGAAQVDPATIRQAMSQDLPYPVDLTEGQMSRDPSQLKFEVETSKDPRLGDPLRQRYEDQHQVMQQNIDAFIDSTGSQATNMREVGLAVDSALQKQLQADKNRVRVAYNKADKSPEAQTPVDLAAPINNGGNPTTILDYLNSQPDLPTTPILSTAKRTAESIGIAQRDANGNLVSRNPTIKQMETWRQEINANTNLEAPNIRQASILKGMIDEHVGPVEGTLYKAARNERVRMGQRWEKTAIMQDLTKKKPNSNDRIVALEDVQKRIIHDGSLDDLRTARRTLLTSGDEGKQAWKDIQGQTLQEIKNAATAGVSPDARGNQMISPAALNKAIKRLDDSGKLDFIFGQQGAEKLRALNDISKTLFTVPASAGVNHSNTAATLLAAIDITMSGLSGFPAPVASALRIATKHIKDNKTRARVQKALNPTPRNP